MNNRMKIQFVARPENESFSRTSVASFISCLDPTMEELTEIKTGVSEAVSNCIIHGYSEVSDGIVTLECIISEDGKITIVISDEGRGIADIKLAREPMFTTGAEDERSGMGFTVMESFMDKVEVESEVGKGTTITMMKRLDLSSYGA